MNTNFFTGRLFAAVFALVLSGTMVIGAVGPAFDVKAPSQSAQGYIA